MHGAFDTGIREAANVMAALTQARGDAVRRCRGTLPFARGLIDTKHAPERFCRWDRLQRLMCAALPAVLQVRPKLPQSVPDADAFEAYKGQELLVVSQALEEVRSPHVCWAFSPVGLPFA